MRTTTTVDASILNPPGEASCLTIGQLRQLIDDLPAASQVKVGVRDGHCFNTLLGELPVRRAAAFAGVIAPTLILDVEGLT